MGLERMTIPVCTRSGRRLDVEVTRIVKQLSGGQAGYHEWRPPSHSDDLSSDDVEDIHEAVERLNRGEP